MTTTLSSFSSIPNPADAPPGTSSNTSRPRSPLEVEKTDANKTADHSASQPPAKAHPEVARMRQLEMQGLTLSEISVTLGVSEAEVVASLGLAETAVAGGVQPSGTLADRPATLTLTGFSVTA